MMFGKSIIASFALATTLLVVVSAQESNSNNPCDSIECQNGALCVIGDWRGLFFEPSHNRRRRSSFYSPTKQYKWFPLSVSVWVDRREMRYYL
jgi:hypothetical protein